MTTKIPELISLNIIIVTILIWKINMLYNMGKISWLLATNEKKFFRPRLSYKLQMYELRKGGSFKRSETYSREEHEG